VSQRALYRLAGWCGILAVVALIVHFAIIGNPPKDSASASTIAAWIQTRHTKMLLSAWLDGIGSLLLVVAVYTFAHLAGDREPYWRRVTSYVATVVIALSFVTDSGLLAATRAASHGQTQSVGTLFSLVHGIDYLYPLANWAWMGALAVLVLRTGILPRFIGYLVGMVGAFEIAVGTTAFFSDGAAAANNVVFMALAVWTLFASVACLSRSTSASTTVPVPVGLPT
jgi:Domain of unknown function (DUF4386)